MSLHGAQRCPVTRMYTQVAGCIPHTPFASLTLPTLAYSTPGHTEGRTLVNTPVETLHDTGCHWQVSVQVWAYRLDRRGLCAWGGLWGPLALLSGWVGLGQAALCSLRVGALEEKAGICRGPAWPAWPRLQALLRAPWGPPWSPAGCDPRVAWGGAPSGGGLRLSPCPLCLSHPAWEGALWVVDRKSWEGHRPLPGPRVSSLHWRPWERPGPLSPAASICPAQRRL